MHTGPLTCSSSVLDEVVRIECMGSGGSPPPANGSILCAINDLPPFNCEMETIFITNNEKHILIGTFPYEISQRPLAAGAHIFTAVQDTTASNTTELIGGAQFFLPRKLII